ncbi:MAG: peptidoglycan-associated lipoprotein Pal [Chromatiales bacterium]|nr:peptidoglycan-associated lipoprotein Pal [Chromatiales bacterium]
MRLQFFAVCAMTLGVALLQGCTGGDGNLRRGDVPVDDISIGADQRGADGRGTEWGGANLQDEFAGRPIKELLTDQNSPLSRQVFYFEFNSAELSAEDRDALATHARFLNSRRDVALILEGHADERGSREYNLALGERRAKVIERVLSLQGVTIDQIQVISFGEERPDAHGHDEESWRLNRRVKLLYTGY